MEFEDLLSETRQRASREDGEFEEEGNGKTPCTEEEEVVSHSNSG